MSKSTQEGPFSLLHHSPAVAESFRTLSDYLKVKSTLPARLRELAILATAKEWGSEYVWQRHLDRAMQQDLTDGLIRHLDGGDAPVRIGDSERVVLDLCTELRQRNGVASSTWSRCVEMLGIQNSVDLLTVALIYRCVVGYSETSAETAVGDFD